MEWPVLSARPFVLRGIRRKTFGEEAAQSEKKGLIPSVMYGAPAGLRTIPKHLFFLWALSNPTVILAGQHSWWQARPRIALLSGPQPSKSYKLQKPASQPASLKH